MLYNEELKTTETQEQITVVEFCQLRRIPIVHIPNEGKRSAVAGGILKRAGMQSGFPDLFIPKASKGYHGLFIEMKVGKNKPTERQNEWLKTLSEEGYAVCVRYGSADAIATIERYLGQNREPTAGNFCVSCGDEIPEGRTVCPNCEVTGTAHS